MKKLLALLCALLFVPCALAEETARARFPGSLGGTIEISPAWEEGWFFADASAYNHALAQASLGLALSAFGAGEGDAAQNVRDCLSSLGFEQIETAQYDVRRPDTIGTALARREIRQGGESATLVALAIRGGNYGQEWLSNFDCGVDEPWHRGFSQAAREAARRAADYVARQNIDRPVFWIAGYSRGAAVANLTAAFLSEEGLAQDEQIFAYTFSTPRTVRGEEAKKHRNIYNIVSAADLVPQTPLAAWGYDRYGQTLYLPSSGGQAADYAALLPGFQAAYQSLTGAPADAAGDAADLSLCRALVKGLATAVPTPERYAAVYQAPLGKLFTGQKLTGAERLVTLSLATALGLEAAREAGHSVSAAEGTERAEDLLVLIKPISTQHMPEIYLAWMLSLPDGHALLRETP